MIVDVECERCRGEGWLLTREPRLGSGLYETTCPKCEGHGAYATSAKKQHASRLADERKDRAIKGATS